ncbi:hypothetical protein Taro_008776 [Colocasia esculenta]|uniref:Uncharacterized protein n=1 Tax=Colocasia esculenta TaxID=4460 RepID=A0A843U4F3_COLES|nr:hypothetical protein [Colocasia esculenta]
MDDCKSDPNPTPDPAPAEEEKAREEAEPAPEATEDSEEEEFVEGEDEDDDEEGEEFEHVSEFAPPLRNPRTPFTNLSQVDADLALARTLQEQERAYMMLTVGAGGRRGDSVGSESGSEYELHYEDEGDGHQLGEHSSVDDSDYDEDAFDAQGTQDPTSVIDASGFEDDEAFARALQDAEEREVAARLMAFAGINDWVAEDARDYGNNTQDTWSDVDPDELSYEELVALGEAVGTASRGLTADTIASLPSVSYKAQNGIEGSNDHLITNPIVDVSSADWIMRMVTL